MLDVSRDDLLFGSEGAVQWGAGHRMKPRTLELYSNQTIYCFEEPANSMQKAIREKVYLHGSRVIDCGTVGSFECLAVILWDYDYVEEVNALGNRTALVFRPFSQPRCVNNNNSGTPGPSTSSASPPWPMDWLMHCVCGERREPFPMEGEEWREFIRGYYVILLYLPSKALKWSWLKAIRTASQSYETRCGTSAAGGETDVQRFGGRGRLRRSPLYATLLQEGNDECADCGASQPTWCVLAPFGVFTCIDCIGVHRQLWANKCREVELDHWPEEDVAFMTGRGNRMVNAELEYCVVRTTPEQQSSVGGEGGGVTTKPTPASTIAEREAYIYGKYVSQRFTRANAEETPRMLAEEMERERLATLSSPNAAMREKHSTTLSGESASSFFFPQMLPDGIASGPPKYCGVVLLLINRLTGWRRPSRFARGGWICVLSNGYQELRTRGGARPSTSRTPDGGFVLASWNEAMQLGVENEHHPLSVSIFSSETKDRLIAAGELQISQVVMQERGSRTASSQREGDEGDDAPRSSEGEEGGPMTPVTARLLWSYLDHYGHRPQDPWTVSLLATYCSYA